MRESLAAHFKNLSPKQHSKDTRRCIFWVSGERDGKVVCSYRMPYLAVQLNAMTEALDKVLPPTDSRRRPDIKLLEAGQFQEVVTHSSKQA